MSETKKLETMDPYYSNGEYLSRIQELMDSGNVDEAMEVISNAKKYDSKYYEGEFPRFNTVYDIFMEAEDFENAKNTLLDVQNKTKDFYQRAYLDLYNVNKKLGEKAENELLLAQAKMENPTSFYEYGYLKLVEINMQKQEYQTALNVLNEAINFRAKTNPNNPSTFEDIQLLDKLKELLKKQNAQGNSQQREN